MQVLRGLIDCSLHAETHLSRPLSLQNEMKTSQISLLFFTPHALALKPISKRKRMLPRGSIKRGINIRYSQLRVLANVGSRHKTHLVVVPGEHYISVRLTRVIEHRA